MQDISSLFTCANLRGEVFRLASMPGWGGDPLALIPEITLLTTLLSPSTRHAVLVRAC